MTNSTLRKRSFRPRSSARNEVGGPRPSSVAAILNYSRALKVVKVPPVGTVHVVLN